MEEPRITAFARRFVGLVFVVLALSFWASTATVVQEFHGADLDYILSSSSNVFLYFPTLGIVALAAFYVPAVIFTDLYWTNKVSAGRVRYLAGLVVVALLAYGSAWYLGSLPRRPMWEMSPAKLELDQATQARCRTAASPTCPVALRDVVQDLRAKALDRLRLSPLVRICDLDPLVEPPSDQLAKRYCFATATMSDAKSCCNAQRGLMQATRNAWFDDGNRSVAAKLDERLFLPLKCFFVIVIVVIGVLLILRKQRLTAHYYQMLPAMERGLQIGALAMLPWLFMDYGQQQTADLLYGAETTFPLRISLVLIPWSLALGIYFADRIKIELVRAVQALGAAFSALALLRVRDVFDYSAKAFGLGAPFWNFLILGAVSVAGVIYFLRWIPGALRGEDKGDIGARQSFDTASDSSRPIS